ncbi:MAG TPA: penicillin acylase family protein [Streptosporangiaceae bacterium]
MTFVVDASGVQGEVQIVRDGFGIPHVRASCAADAWFGMGYACAQDRLFQLDYDRRRAAGRWAEVAGRAGVPGDVLSRRMGIIEAAHADLAVMSAPVRDMFEAYARGVNAVIATGACPPGLEGTVIEPWQAWHSVAAYKVRHILMGMWQHKLAEAMLLARAGAEAFNQLDTRSPAGSPLSVPPEGRLAQAIAEAVDEVARAAPHLGFLAEVEPGSNAWAVSGRRTAHGGAVLCNDSHRALDAPNVYWQCHLDCPDFQVTGAAFPGVPGFPHFGHNGQVAWAITHAHADTQDLYLERFDPSRPGWYETEDGWAQASRRTETISVRDGRPVTITAWATRHGPVVHGDPRTGAAIALKYTATRRPGRGFEPLLPMLTARDVAELCDGQRGWVDPVNNLVAADTGGRIAYQTRGEIPVRSSADHRRLPVPGWDGRSEWTGIVPFASMPRAIDPEAGFVMTANNVIAEGDEPYITYSFGHPFRAERIRGLLAATDRHTTEGLAAIQGDVTSWAAQGWGRILTGLSPLPDEGAEQARAMLAGWDGVLDAGSGPALLYGCFLRALADALYRPLLGDITWDWLISGEVAAADSPVRRWLANDTWALLGGPVPDGGTSARDVTRRQRVLGVLPVVLAAAWRQASKAGPPQDWHWGEHHMVSALHPLSDDLAPPPVSMGGDSETIQAATYSWPQGTPFEVTLTSVYRQVVDLAAPQRASSVIPGGASADPASPHFADQFAQWVQCRRVPMLWDWADIDAAATARTTLTPDPGGTSGPVP